MAKRYRPLIEGCRHMADTATERDDTIARLVASAPPLSEAVRTTIAALFKAGA